MIYELGSRSTAASPNRSRHSQAPAVAYVDKSATTNAKQLVRFGYLAKNTTASDTTLRMAWACGFVDAVKA